jgi:hypothetical protein
VLAAFHKWARIVMSLFVHKAFCIAYQPFLKNAKSKIWPAARQWSVQYYPSPRIVPNGADVPSALRHCHALMDKFILLATDSDFEPFHWSWPGNHQPMHAVMIMLIDLYERPTSAEAPKSRAFVDKVFSLMGPDGGVAGGEDGIPRSRPLKDGGREAWDMLRRLREKAWLKAGLDPKLVWPEQVQTQATVSQPPPGGAVHGHVGSRDETAGTAMAFPDQYYAMIKEADAGYRAPGQSARRDHNVPESLHQAYRGEPSHSSLAPDRSWEGVQRAAVPGAMPLGHRGTVLQAPAQNPGESFFAFPSRHGHETASGFPTGQSLNTLGTNISPAGLASAASMHPPHQHQQDPMLQDPTFAHDRTDPDANVQFDWDQWNAVFGEYLPLADELMELDPQLDVDMAGNPGASQQAQYGQQQQQHGQPGNQPGMFGDDGTEFGQNPGGNNWADFG